MLNSPLKKAFFLAWIVLIIQPTFAQNATKSPYSFFGIGEPAIQNFVQDMALGGASVARRESNSINPLNPSSYASLKYTVFEGGGKIDLGRRFAGENSSEFSNTAFNYFALAFPLKAEKAGMAMGLSPLTHRGFDLLSQGDTGINAYEGSFLGKGDLSKAYVGIGVSPLKGLSLGANVAAIFGTFQEVNVLRYINDPLRFGFYDQSNTYFSGMSWDLGVQYNVQHQKGIRQTFAAAVQLPFQLSRSQDRLVRNFNDPNFLASPEFYAYDTVLAETGDITPLEMPMQWSVGYALGKENKWNVIAEYQVNSWGGLNNQGIQGRFADGQKIAGGVWFVPGDITNFKTPYLKKIRYSLGARQQDMPWVIGGSQITETGMTLGFGLPVYRTITLTGGKESLLSHVNLAFEVFRREGESLTENYFRMHFGFTFCDKWFIKRKYL
jgi:hypothetical protein